MATCSSTADTAVPHVRIITVRYSLLWHSNIDENPSVHINRMVQWVVGGHLPTIEPYKARNTRWLI
jgi:hypothetical protein